MASKRRKPGVDIWDILFKSRQALVQSKERRHSVIQSLKEKLRESEDKFLKASRLSRETVAITNLDTGKFLEANDSFLRSMGYTRDEVIGHSGVELGIGVKPEQRERIAGKLKKQGRLENESVQLRTKSGKIIEASTSAELISINGKECIIWVSTDIAELKQADNELRKFKVISDIADHGITIVDPEGYVSYVNPSFASMHGYTPDEVIGKHLSIFHTEQQMVRVNRLVEQLKRYGSYTAQEVWHKRRDNTEFSTLMDGTVVRDENGTPLFLAAIAVEITGRKQEYQQLTALRARPRAVTTLLRSFSTLGLQDLSDQQVIELLLGLTLPSQSAGKLARECIEKFHNLAGFMGARTRQLQEIGLPDNCILCLRLIHELPVHVLKQRAVEQPAYNSSRELFDYLEYSMRDLDREVFKVIFLDEKNHIKEIADLFTGTKNQIPVSARDIIESALNHGADSLVLVHNHTSGNPSPSKTDTIFTRDMIFVGILLQINVLDHIIVGGNSYFSFADSGLLQKYKDSFLTMKIKGILSAGRLYQYIPSRDRAAVLNTLINELDCSPASGESAS
jgi:DNA repair protein RadC